MIREFSPDSVFATLAEKAQKLCDNKEYKRSIRYIATFYHSLGGLNRAEILNIVAECYWNAGEERFALTTLKHALKYNPDNFGVIKKLIGYYLDRGDRYDAQMLFMRVRFGNIEEEQLQELGAMFGETAIEDDIVSVPYEETRYRVLTLCDSLAESGCYSEAVSKAEALAKNRGDDAILYNKLALYACGAKDYIKARYYARLMLKDPDYAVAGYCTMAYIYKSEDAECDISYIIQQLIQCPVKNIDELSRIVGMIETECDYDYLLSYVEETEKGVLGQSYSLMLIKAITLYNLDRIDDARKVFKEICDLYGLLGNTALYWKEFECVHEAYTPVFQYDMLPMTVRLGDISMFDTAEDISSFSEDKLKICLMADLCLLSEKSAFAYIRSYSKYLDMMSVDSICTILNMDYDIPVSTRCAVMMYLVTQRGADTLDINTPVGVVTVDIDTDTEGCSRTLERAYIFAQLCCICSGRNGWEVIRDSMVRLRDMIGGSEFNFSNVRALAGCIILDTYILHEESADEDFEDRDIDIVSQYVGVGRSVIKKYLTEIRKVGSYYDLSVFDIFFKQAKMFFDREFSGDE